MSDRTEYAPGVYRVAQMHVVTACNAESAEALFLAENPDACVLQEATARIETTDGRIVDAPELCGYVHVGRSVLTYDGESFKDEISAIR